MKILGLEKVYFVNDPDFRMESMLSVESLTWRLVMTVTP